MRTTGKVLLESTNTPTGSDGVPAVYEEIGGREYIAFCVAGGDGLNLGVRRGRGAETAPPPSAYMAFALPG